MKITLYILNHNYGHFLREAIYSALNQDFDDYEILIIDDGSTDDSRKILKEFVGCEKVRIVFQENMGLMASINSAWKEASGEYVMRLDADDTLRHDALKTLANYAQAHPGAEWIFPGFYTTSHKGVIIKSENRGVTPYFIHRDDVPPHGACSIIKREILKNVGGYSEHVKCRDGLDLFLKIRDGNKVLSIPEFLFFYRRHDKNLTLNKQDIMRAEKELLRVEEN